MKCLHTKVSVDVAARRRSVASQLLDRVADAGIQAIFGIPGGAISPFLGALRAQDRLRYVIARHEGGAAFMADGYARASDGFGVCLVTAGPGATNALTGIAAAAADGAPVLLLTGEVPTDRWGQGAIQESTAASGLDIVGVYRHVLEHSAAAPHPDSAIRLFERALAVVRGRPGRSAHLAVPVDVARGNVVVARPVPAPRAPSVAIVDDTIDAIHDALIAARRPLIVLGSGARRALGERGPALGEWAEREGIAVTTTVRAKGIFPERSPASLGVVGLGGGPRVDAYLADGVDLILVLGTRLGEWSSSAALRSRAGARVIQVDLDPAAIGRTLAVDTPIVADVDAVVAALLARTEPDPSPGAEPRRRALAEARAIVDAPAGADAPAGPIRPQRLMAELQRHLDGAVDLYVDMGNCTGWATRCLTIDPPARLFVPCGLSTMGWSCGAVIGGKIARPERRAIALCGDGAFLMNGVEINTAARYRVGSIHVVLNDDALGMVNHGERAQTGHPLDDGYYGLGSPDLVELARALGADAHRVDAPDELAPALAAAIAAADAESRPQVIVVRIDPTEAPPYGERFRAVSGR